MENKIIYTEKEIDAKIEHLEEFQEEVKCFIESLEQMQESATNVCEAMKSWRNPNE